MQEYHDLIVDGIKLLSVAAAAYGGVKTSLSAIKSDLIEIKIAIKDVVNIQRQHGEDIAVLKDRVPKRQP